MMAYVLRSTKYLGESTEGGRVAKYVLLEVLKNNPINQIGE